VGLAFAIIGAGSMVGPNIDRLAQLVASGALQILSRVTRIHAPRQVALGRRDTPDIGFAPETTASMHKYGFMTLCGIYSRGRHCH
jgi:hypothetical protein